MVTVVDEALARPQPRMLRWEIPTVGTVPLLREKFIALVPATAGAVTVTVPLVEPFNVIDPVLATFTPVVPSTIVAM
jgi:hypothetical protein